MDKSGRIFLGRAWLKKGRFASDDDDDDDDDDDIGIELFS
jgi:hypothetical protein